jgi:hypothetical protein
MNFALSLTRVSPRFPINDSVPEIISPPVSAIKIKTYVIISKLSLVSKIWEICLAGQKYDFSVQCQNGDKRAVKELMLIV